MKVCHDIAPTNMGMSLFYAMRIISLALSQKLVLAIRSTIPNVNLNTQDSATGLQYENLVHIRLL